MSNELWVEGVIIEFKSGCPCNRAMIRRVGGNEIVLADILTGTVHKLDLAALEVSKNEGEINFLADPRYLGELKFFDLTEKEQLEVNRRYKYIKGLKERGISKVTAKTSQLVIQEVSEELGEAPPHWQSVRGWQRSFVEAGEKLRGLYPKHRLKGDRSSRLDKRVVKIIEDASSRYFNASQPSIASIVRNVEAKIIAHNMDCPHDLLTMPSYLTIQRKILSESYQKRQKSRKGARSLDAELAGAVSAIESSYILERVEIDHTQIDLAVLHDDHKTLLGRPYITALIDHYSHMLLGFQLSFEPPSFASVCIACLNAFLPKDLILANLAITETWPAHGVPVLLVTDNANEFWGKNFEVVADEVGPVFQYCPIRNGRYKSRIERFFGIVNSLVLDDLPGVVRKKGQCSETYNSGQHAEMTFTEFKKYFTTWLTEVYHNTPLENGMTPNELWNMSALEFPVATEDEMEITPMLMATKTRQLGKGGIHAFKLTYNSPILKDLYRRDGPRMVTIKYNPFDIGHILVLDELNKVYLSVDCDEYTYACGLSLYEHGQIRALANQLRISKLDSPDLQLAKVKLAKERDDLHARNLRRLTQKTAAKAARSEKIGIDAIKLVVDNTKGVIQVEDDDDELSLDGWSVD